MRGMLYAPNLHYFFSQKDFPFEKAFLVTASAVARSCTHYLAELITPVAGVEEKEKSGELPKDPHELARSLSEIVKWLFSSSENPELFAFFIDDAELGSDPKKIAKFDHHDDTCCWVLNVSEDEFAGLQDAWRSEGLPEDLFTPCDE